MNAESTAPGPRSDGRARSLRFVLVFAAVLALLHGIYFAIPDPIMIDVLIHGIVAVPSAWVIDLLSSERVWVSDATIYSRDAAIQIIRGCDGSGSAFLLSAAIIALGAPLLRTLVGLVAGLLLVHAVNTARIVGLFFVVAHQPELFQTAHTLVAPAVIVLLGCLFFLAWGHWSLSRADAATD